MGFIRWIALSSFFNIWGLGIKRQFEENWLEVQQNELPEGFDPIISYSNCFSLTDLSRITTEKDTATENP